jgi:putative SOS response-associated peptidase YedK
MCGRYATTRTSVELSELFEALDETNSELLADYNVAPTDPAPIVRVSQRVGGRVLSIARWGLVPPWATDLRGGARMINARAETVATSSAYGPSFARRRCLVPADGWYEWLSRPEGINRGLAQRGAAGKRKQAYFMTPPDGSPLAFGGLWSVWGQGDARVLTCSIITTAALGDLVAVHDRMPLVLPAHRWDAWLDGPITEGLLTPASEAFLNELEIRPVGALVGDVRNDGPKLIERIAVPPANTQSDEPQDLTLF